MVEIVNNEAGAEWEARVDGELCGYAEYRSRPGRITFTHTVVEPEHEGKGIASALAKAAIEHAVANEQRILPVCPFIRSWLKRHSEYHAWVDWPPDSSGAA